MAARRAAAPRASLLEPVAKSASPPTVTRMADDALYQAKASGKDRIVAVQAEPNS